MANHSHKLDRPASGLKLTSLIRPSNIDPLAPLLYGEEYALDFELRNGRAPSWIPTHMADDGTRRWITWRRKT